MTEDDARAWVEARYGADGVAAMEQLAALVTDENKAQNLIAPSTIASIWTRHIVDSAQLIKLSETSGIWLDIGSGAGFPGLVVAALTARPVTLVEPRKRRVDFLLRAISELGIESRTRVVGQKVENLDAGLQASTISARAVANLDSIFAGARQCSTWNTEWLLPKGRSANAEVANAKRAWQGMFHVEQSITDPDSMIVVAKQVRPK